jgi:hypothetical protein
VPDRGSLRSSICRCGNTRPHGSLCRSTPGFHGRPRHPTPQTETLTRARPPRSTLPFIERAFRNEGPPWGQLASRASTDWDSSGGLLAWLG